VRKIQLRHTEWNSEGIYYFSQISVDFSPLQSVHIGPGAHPGFYPIIKGKSLADVKNTFTPPHIFKVKGTATPVQTWTCPEGSRRLRIPDFMTICTWRWQSCQPYTPAAFIPQEILLVLISVKRLSRPQGHSAAGRIMSGEKFRWHHRRLKSRTSGFISSGCRAQIRIWIPSLLHTYPSHLILCHLILMTISVEQYVQTMISCYVPYQLFCTALCIFTQIISSCFYAFRCLFALSSGSFNLTTVPSQHIICLYALVGCLSKIVVFSQTHHFLYH
jgi:hypothetical protein